LASVLSSLRMSRNVQIFSSGNLLRWKILNKIFLI
jgi:hypothetical protein